MTTVAVPALPSAAGARAVAALWLATFAAVMFLVGFEQGTITAGAPVLHEAFHDARHLLGFPCH